MEYTKTELSVSALINKNPLIKTLIDTFDLHDEYDNEIREVRR